MSTIEIDGHVFEWDIERSEYNEAPWAAGDDGRGIVSQWTNRSKRPGERILDHSGDEFLYYDWAATIKKAHREGWALCETEQQILRQSLRREPTRREIVARAVERDFDDLRRWCTGEWHWTSVVVECQETGKISQVGGFRSDDFCDFGEAQTAQDLAHELLENAKEARRIRTMSEVTVQGSMAFARRLSAAAKPAA